MHLQVASAIDKSPSRYLYKQPSREAEAQVMRSRRAGFAMCGTEMGV